MGFAIEGEHNVDQGWMDAVRGAGSAGAAGDPELVGKTAQIVPRFQFDGWRMPDIAQFMSEAGRVGASASVPGIALAKSIVELCK